MSIQNKKNETNNQTFSIDKMHSIMMNKYEIIETETIPALLVEKQRIKNKIRGLNDNQIEEFLELKDTLQKVKIEIQTLKEQKTNYLLCNSKYVFNYFEEKQNICNRPENNQKNVNILNSFFKIKAVDEETANVNSYKYNSSKMLYQNYWKNVNNEILNIQDFSFPMDICQICKRGELIPQDEDGILICNNNSCGSFVTYIADNSKPTNKEPPNEVSYTAYIRLNHFKEILSQFQAKETTQIPEAVIDAIRNRIKKERITDIAKEINYNKMRDILRKLNLNKYFEHIQYINSLFGIKPPIMNEELHETLCVLFIEIQKPWAIHCPPNRTNFFNYTYTLYQLCVLLDQTQYLPYIPLLKDRQKQLEQDMIWKKVCNDLLWLYIPTI
jgi:hypothetical protein